MAKKLALLVGCNYSNNPDVPKENKLHGCIKDVYFMRDLIRQPFFGFQDENITILTDDVRGACTFLAITTALKGLIDKAKEGDTLLFYFSGGGALVNPSVNPPVTNEIKKVPVIVPCEDKPISPITGKDILDILKPLPDGAFFTFICDSSYSGGLFNENVQTESNVPDPGLKFHRKNIPSNILRPNALPPPPIPNKHIILLHSSKANEESVEVYPNGDESMAVSAFSNAIQTLFNSPVAGNDHLTARNIAAFTRAMLGFIGFDQRPDVRFGIIDDAATPFLGHVA